MTDQTNAPAGENAEPSASGEVDAQLAEMHDAETVDADNPAEPGEVKPGEEKPEVKKVVPLAALHEERRARQELQRQLQEISRKQAERDTIIEQRLAALANPPKQGPTREDDPVGYLDNRIGELTAAQRHILEQNQQREQQQAHENALNQVKSRVVQAATSFGKETPDFKDAVKHLNDMRTRELMTLGASQEQAAARAEAELDEAAIQWTVQGRDPAHTAYEFAKARGYTAKAATQQTPADKIAAQQKGTAAAKSLGGGGAVSAGKLTAQAIADMSNDDFAKLSESDWRQAWGG